MNVGKVKNIVKYGVGRVPALPSSGVTPADTSRKGTPKGDVRWRQNRHDENTHTHVHYIDAHSMI